MQSLLDREFFGHTFLVLDLETTGLVAGRHEIVEIAAVKVSVGSPPSLVLDSLVCPSGHLGASHIHGIQPKDVATAPNFEKVLPAMTSAAANRVLAAYNARFDMSFLTMEARIRGQVIEPPYVCIMELFGALVMRGRKSLAKACGVFDLDVEIDHSAAKDALASAHLLRRILRLAYQQGARTFADLAAVAKGCRFAKTFNRELVPVSDQIHQKPTVQPRSGARPVRNCAFREYMDAVGKAVSDLAVTDAELYEVQGVANELGLSQAERRAVHARVYLSMLERYSEDMLIDKRECENIERLSACLRVLGWAPGD